jgi:hypothetical protein
LALKEEHRTTRPWVQRSGWACTPALHKEDLHGVRQLASG